MTPERSQSTEDAYLRRVEQLRRQTARSLGHPDTRSVSPMDLVEHLIGRKESSKHWQTSSEDWSEGKKARHQPPQTLSRATWRQYKGSLLFVLEQELSTTTEGVVAEELNVAIHLLRSEPQSGALKRSLRTSGSKLKAMPSADFKIVMQFLDARIGRHTHANTLRTWLRANQLVGLRPAEWLRAGLIQLDGQPALRVANAKHTNGRANGEYRTLVLERVTSEEIEHIDDLLYMLVEMEKLPGYDFDRHMKQLQAYMRTVTRRCLGKRSRYPTLYSGRHQFVADAKSGHRSHGEIAALVGHGSDRTATTHYGRAAKGEGDIKVSALPSEIATVRNHPKTGYRHPKRTDR
ncbi:MAG: hypothetical protein ACREPQ_00345 [Rhodanobacter sp.]